MVSHQAAMESLWAKGQKEDAWKYYKNLHGKSYQGEEVSSRHHMH
jgi:hypothetical protein